MLFTNIKRSENGEKWLVEVCDHYRLPMEVVYASSKKINCKEYIKNLKKEGRVWS